MDDRELIAGSAREILAEEFDARRLHAFYDGAAEAAEHLWQLATEMGWLSAATPERLSGLGLDPSVAFAILRECGRRAVPGAILPALVASVWAAGLDEGADLELIGSQVAEGKLRPFIPSLDWSVSARVRSGTLSGAVQGMIGWSNATAALVPAMQDGQRVMALAEMAEGSTSVEAGVTWDRTRRTATLNFDGARVIGVLNDPDGSHSARLRMLFQLALSADSVGGAEQLLEITTAYTRERQQFGRPVGSFQALKHRIANIYLDAVQSGRLHQYAVDLYSKNDPDVAQWALLAKAETTEVFARTADESVLLHGGVGFTWAFDPHIYLKRALFNRRAGGDPRALRNEAWACLNTASETGRSTAEITA
jgi:alkylation response protein AidB-like acyl-CoA dehydrogenase